GYEAGGWIVVGDDQPCAGHAGPDKVAQVCVDSVQLEGTGEQVARLIDQAGFFGAPPVGVLKGTARRALILESRFESLDLASQRRFAGGFYLLQADLGLRLLAARGTTGRQLLFYSIADC